MKPALGILAVASAALLTACGNDKAFNADVDAVKLGFQAMLSGPGAGAPAAPTHLTNEAVASILQAIPKPMMMVTYEDKDAVGVVSLIETNGQYKTYGNASRQAMIFNNGILTNTRGLGADLMSSSVEQSRRLVQGRRAGQATRVNRYLDGEDKTVEIRFACTVTAGGSKSVQQGEVRGSGRVMTETCTSADTKIQNSYLVNSAGRILWSRQWIGDDHGYVTIAPIRL